MKEKDLKEILKSKFQLVEGKYFSDQWKSVLSLFFKKIDYFSSPDNLFSENDKVINGKQIGTVKLDDGKQLAIFTVEVADNISIVRNRQGLREIAAKYIDQNIIHGSIAFFYNRNQLDYRLSFIAKEASIDLQTGQMIKGETKPKRYTYLLGANEACTTPAKRMLVLADKKDKGEVNINQLKEVFSVEALNKDFFKTYKAHYEKFWKYLADEENPLRIKLIDADKETKEKKEKPIRDFVKKLLGRIVFLHFLQKKGWMGCLPDTNEWIDGEPRFMQKLFENFSKPANFHTQCLVKLFFETLNTKRNDDAFEVKGLTGKLNGSRVPYLNGGLFEPEKNKATLEIDFPENFFKELLEFFEQYNFTIDENSPDDHEVGIDPEMLGHIFENLLEDNRDKGAFYTPKEIVQYMCKESLIQYLLNTFQEQKDIEQFIRFHSVSFFLAEKENAVLLNKKLDDIKVCDPAIGSGAFPIGMLQEIFEAKRFIYPYLKTNQNFKPAEVKKNIIQNSIYGVDLEKGAVDIAQLRFWLSLVVDELNPHPLPNLDYKIMQGNSLLEHFEGIELGKVALFEEPKVRIIEPTLFEEPKAEYGFSKENRTNIKELIADYFKVEEKTQKTTIHKQIDAIVMKHIDKSLEFFENKLLIEIATYEKQLKGKLDGQTENFKQGYLVKSKEVKEIEKRKTQLATKTAARKRLLEFENTDERPYFLWHLYFMDVFEKGGFDVMIGNPPYIQLQKMGKKADILQEAGYETFARTGDIYCLFYEKGIALLKKENGILSYITSNSWLRTQYGLKLRQFFKNKTNPLALLNFVDTQIFPSATVEVNIAILKKQKNKNKLIATAIVNRLAKLNLNEYVNNNSIELNVLDDNGWTIADIQNFKIKQKVEFNTVPLWKLNYSISYGLKTGFDKAFYINEEDYNNLLIEDKKNLEIIKPVVRGRDVRKFGFEQSRWLINTHNGIRSENIPPIDVVNDFPTIYKHLLKFEKELKNRGDKGVHWTNLRNCAYLREFDKEKIIWAQLTDGSKMAFDNSGVFGNAKIFIMTGENLRYLLAIFNSPLCEWYYNQISTTTGVGTNQWSKDKMEVFPIKMASEIVVNKVELVTNYLITIEKLNSSMDIFIRIDKKHLFGTFYSVLNMIVYELYFEEEMKAKEIDVLQFVNEKAFPDITKAEDKKAIIQKVFYELQQKDNLIRNRILVASSRSETIARINAATS
jgi:hypothetical protein